MVAGIRSLLNDSDFLDMLNVSDSEIPEWLKNVLLQQSAQNTESKNGQGKE